MSWAFDKVEGKANGAAPNSASKIDDSHSGAVENVSRICPASRPSLTFDAKDIRGQVYTLGKFDTIEIELSILSHTILMFRDGISGRCEWHNGNESRRLSLLPSSTVIFNPAKEYLLIRKGRSQSDCRLLLLTIPPIVLSRINSHADELIDVHFSQQIGMDDPIICQALLAVEQEMESPGLNNASYLDSLLMLLLNRLVRCAYNVAIPITNPKYAKGGLAPWRLTQVT